MKKLLILPLLILTILTSCNQVDDTVTPPSRVVINVNKQFIENGSTVTKPANAIIHLWKAEDRDFDVAASGEDIYVGYAYDKTSKSSFNADYGSVGFAINEDLTPGRYFVYVVLNKSSASGSQAYTHTYIDIKAGERFFYSKVFSHDVGNQQYEVWTKNR